MYLTRRDPEALSSSENLGSILSGRSGRRAGGFPFSALTCKPHHSTPLRKIQSPQPVAPGIKPEFLGLDRKALDQALVSLCPARPLRRGFGDGGPRREGAFSWAGGGGAPDSPAQTEMRRFRLPYSAASFQQVPDFCRLPLGLLKETQFTTLVLNR